MGIHIERFVAMLAADTTLPVAPKRRAAAQIEVLLIPTMSASRRSAVCIAFARLDV
jgi:hypothetical protein